MTTWKWILEHVRKQLFERHIFIQTLHFTCHVQTIKYQQLATINVISQRCFVQGKLSLLLYDTRIYLGSGDFKVFQSFWNFNMSEINTNNFGTLVGHSLINDIKIIEKTKKLTNLASTSVETRPGIIFSISSPNRTNWRKINKKQSQQYWQGGWQSPSPLQEYL